MVRTYKELVAWQKGMALVKAIYALVKQFPKIEQYRLVDQLTRAAVSVPSNIAEGFGRATNKDFAHFLSQARGSLFEVETQLLIAKDLGFVGDVEPELELSSELGRILNGLIRKLSSIPPAP
ncbi:MAG: four helix bundle protein [Kiritimatiellae bacterium]|nr:four helix bundle protein [Kiritimatiellia bacterium]MBR3925004.1 four helix bundle protein [Kiritimatiellia bacterium]